MEVPTDIQAKRFAILAHKGQLYGDNRLYTTHLARVAGFFEGSITLRAIAWLHDVVEDTDISLITIDALFGGIIARAVDAISRREETYSTYLTRVQVNDFAKQVKLIDLADNLSNCYNSRGRVKEEHKIKQKRYVKAIRRLLR